MNFIFLVVVMSSLAIGIDLGTTFSCAAIYRQGKGVDIIPNEDGEFLIPSIAYFDPKSGKPLVGKYAYDEIPECQQNGLYDAKRIIGRKFNDEYVSRFLTSNEVPFTIVRGRDDQAAFELTIDGKPVIKTPEEVSAELLKYIKTYASSYLGTNVEEVVISIPAYFSNAQRKCTKRAAEIAGLKVLRLVTEPTAAAIHYITDRDRSNLNILVYDFGGGTLDISLIKVTDQLFEVKAVYGDTFLGGRNIDKVLFEHFQNKLLRNQVLPELRKRIFLRRLRDACVEVKKKLSQFPEVKYPIPCSFGGDEEIFLTMTRVEFETLTRDILDRAFELAKVCLEDSGKSITDVDEVVLIGGTSRIPKIREKLNSHFGADKIRTSINADQAVAAGAALQACLLKTKIGDLEKYNVREVTPLSLGIQVGGGLMLSMIPRNSCIPFKKTQECCTCCNDQESVIIPIFEGERRNTKYNNALGELTLKGLPNKRAGDVTIYITMSLDEDGILNVTAHEKSTGVKNNLSVTMGQFGLSEKKIELSVKEAKKRLEEDRVFEDFTRLKINLVKITNHILYDLNKISSQSDKDFVKRQCNEFIVYAMEDLSFTETDALKTRFGLLNNQISRILQENLMLQVKY